MAFVTSLSSESIDRVTRPQRPLSDKQVPEEGESSFKKTLHDVPAPKNKSLGRETPGQTVMEKSITPLASSLEIQIEKEEMDFDTIDPSLEITLLQDQGDQEGQEINPEESSEESSILAIPVEPKPLQQEPSIQGKKTATLSAPSSPTKGSKVKTPEKPSNTSTTPLPKKTDLGEENPTSQTNSTNLPTISKEPQVSVDPKTIADVIPMKTPDLRVSSPKARTSSEGNEFQTKVTDSEIQLDGEVISFSALRDHLKDQGPQVSTETLPKEGLPKQMRSDSPLSELEESFKNPENTQLLKDLDSPEKSGPPPLEQEVSDSKKENQFSMGYDTFGNNSISKGIQEKGNITPLSSPHALEEAQAAQAQFTQFLGSQALKTGLNKFSFQMTPHSLGRVQVEMQIAKDGKVMAVISADRGETLDLLQKGSSQIEAILAESGLKVDPENLQFDLRQESGDPEQQKPEDLLPFASNANDVRLESQVSKFKSHAYSAPNRALDRRI